MHWMYQDSAFMSGDMFGIGLPPFIFVLLPLMVWALLWKGWALWLAARRGDLLWFLVLLVINTFGLLEIFYIFVIAKQKDSKEELVKIVPEDKN